MARLPQQYAPLVYGIIQAAITTAVATAIATHQFTDFNMRFVEEWFLAWGISFLTMLPVVIFVAPFIQRCVLALTLSTAGDVRTDPCRVAMARRRTAGSAISA
jgi:hypothetical protein